MIDFNAPWARGQLTSTKVFFYKKKQQHYLDGGKLRY